MQVQISAGRTLKERAVYTILPGPVCKCTGQCTLQVQNFFFFLIGSGYFAVNGILP